ncbi:MAG: zinc ribbon domain-containing protein [Oscillospiraceae bacterium]
MVCPKCRKTVGDNDAVCSNCGVALKEPKKEKSIKGIFNKKKKAARENLKTVTKKATGKKTKVILSVAAVILIIALVIVLAVHLTGDKGNKIAGEFAEFIGSPLSQAENDTGYHLKSDSAFRSVNKVIAFDEIYESEDEVRIDDISYPQWAVTVNLNQSNKIDSVVYTDFKSIKSDSRGEKKDKLINLEKFDKGTKFNTVADEIDLDPYSITYKSGNTTYVYKYYYETDYGDAQTVVLSVTFDSDDKFLYDSAEYVYPQNM